MERNKFTEAQDKWLKALDGGGYEQCRDELHADGAYCCLGVATHVVDPLHHALENNGWARDDYLDDWTEEELGGLGDDEKTAPPEVVHALHLNGTSGEFRWGMKHLKKAHLVGLNDDEELSFAQIAAFIREKPWFVFTNFDFPEASS